MRRFSFALVLVALAAMGAAVVAQGNAHFIASATSAVKACPNLRVAFKEAGLASGSVETVQVSANATAVYACINKGGKNPSAANKRSVSSTVSTSGTFRADRSGNIVGSLTLTPPPDTFQCPSGQTKTLLSVTYTNVVVKDLTSGATYSIAGTYSCP